MNYDNWKLEAPPVCYSKEEARQDDPLYAMERCDCCGDYYEEEDIEAGLCPECREFINELKNH